MQGQNRTGIILRVVVGLMLIIVFAVVAFGVQAQVAADLRTYAGRVTGFEDQLVAIGIENGEATIYICDGRLDTGTVSIAEWFVGPLVDNVVDITAPSGNRVQATLAETTAEGQFTFADGTIKAFTLELLPAGTPGLYRSEFGFGDLEFVGGWLVLPDGTVRGAVFNAATHELTAASFIDFSTGTGGPAAEVTPVG